MENLERIARLPWNIGIFVGQKRPLQRKYVVKSASASRQRRADAAAAAGQIPFHITSKD